PKSEAHTAQPDATELSELCYQYKYDHRNRLVEKKIPGKGWESIIYNRLDQPVMTQDKELKNANKWLVTKYDVFGRVVYTGIKNSTGARTDFQNLLNNNNVDYETKESVGTGYMNTYYTSNSFPVSLDEIHTINYYDNYYFDLRGGISETAYGVTPITNVKGLATGSKVRVLGTNDWITTVTYYNEESRPIYVYSINDYLDSTDKIKSALAFDGTVEETNTIHDKNFHTIDVKDKYTYDHMNRPTVHTQLLNNAALPEVISNNEYDDLGQLVKKGIGNKENVTSRLQDVDYEYNIRGWLKRINTINELEGDLFSFEIEYNTPSQSGADGLFNGNISQINWQTESDEVLYSYVYEYDALNRIKGAGFYGQNSNNRYNLSNITYDKNGNILSLTRNGHVVASPDGNIGSHFGVMDQLTYTYETSSNQLKKVDDSANTTYGFKDGSNTTIEYTYDDNGNMLTDANKGITSISYNHLNLPTSVSLTGGNITYIYDATGVKQKKIVSTGTTTEYAGNYIYENGTLKMFSHAEGYVEPIRLGKLSQFNYVYQYKDHLGNVRLTYMDQNQNNKSIPVLEIIEENNYYPFGGLHKGYNKIVSANSNSMARKYKYNGKELEESLGYGMYEYEARHYDPWTARFVTVDPLAEDYNFQTPYAYAANDPVRFIDKLGMGPEDIIVLGNSAGAGGVGHQAILIGDEENGWVYISKDGAEKEGGAFGKSRYTIQSFDSLDDFKDSIHNFETTTNHSKTGGGESEGLEFKLDEDGNKIQRYDQAYYIETDGNDDDAINAATNEVKKNYCLTISDCSDVPKVALKELKTPEGKKLKTGESLGLVGETPRVKQKVIELRNKGKDYDSKLVPTSLKPEEE
ncbi:RHS repeat domain-containing protein, partial [Winogradskyella sp.]